MGLKECSLCKVNQDLALIRLLYCPPQIDTSESSYLILHDVDSLGLRTGPAAPLVGH